MSQQFMTILLTVLGVLLYQMGQLGRMIRVAFGVSLSISGIDSRKYIAVRP